MRNVLRSGLSRAVLIAGMAGLLAACSTDVTRFNDNPFATRAVETASVTDTGVPTPRVESAPLDPPRMDTSSSVRRVRTVPQPATQSPFAEAVEAPATTGSVQAAPAFGGASPATPAVRNMAMERAAQASGGRGGWSAAGGTSIRTQAGDTVDGLSRRFGVPATAIRQANSLGPTDAISPGQGIVIPTYSIGAGAAAATGVAAATAVAVTRAAPRPVATQAPATAAVPQRVSVLRTDNPATRSQMATAPVPAPRMQWQPGAEASRPAQPARPAQRPETHTVAIGESLASIGQRYGIPRNDLARMNDMPVERPIRVGQVLRLQRSASTLAARTPAVSSRPAVATAPANRQEQAERSVAQVRTTPAARAADPQTTASVPPATRRTEPVDPAAPAPAAQAPAVAAAQPATPAAPVAASEPQFRWPVRGRIIAPFRAGSNDGIKVAVPEGTPIKAAEDGVVAYAGSELRGYGNLVLVRHANGFVTAYAHNSELRVRRGDQVRRGQTIATAGQTGNVASPQLHFEIRRGSTPVDPIAMLGSN